MNIKNYLFFASLSIIIFFSSCELYNPTEKVPAYIHIDKINLTTKSIEGSSSNKITDAWVYIDDQLIGCFELPSTFPVLIEGQHQLKIYAGIKVNGISESRSPYPFYDFYSQTINLQKTTTLNITPNVKYASNVHFDFMEDFEGAGVIIAKDSASGTDTSLIQLFAPNINVFEGNSSGAAYLNNHQYLYEGVSNTSYILPKGVSPIFLELNYKCNHEFIVGVYSHQGSTTSKNKALTLRASPNWNKTYVYLTPIISGSGNATDFNIFFGMVNYSGSDSLALLLDNIKLVHY
jgi:hypothetical protein